MFARQVGYALGAAVDAVVRNGFGCVGWLAVKAQPASYRDRADWLADVEAETEVLPSRSEILDQMVAEAASEDMYGGTADAWGRDGRPDFVGCDCPSRQAADLDDHASYCSARLPVDERAAALLDHIEALLEFHRAGIDSREGMHCHCGTWVLNEANHRAHQAQVIADMVEADGRVQPTVRKHQQ